MNTREQIIEKIRKVAELAQKGVEGEKTNAEELVTSLMKKYNVTWEEIEEDKEKYNFLYDKRISDFLAKRLYVQIFCKVTGLRKGINFFDGQSNNAKEFRKILKNDGKKANMVIHASIADFITIKTMFDFYYTRYKELEDSFFAAFVIKNDLLPPESVGGYEPSDNEMEKILPFVNVIDKDEYQKRLCCKN